MTNDMVFGLYSGDGRTLEERGERVPPFRPPFSPDDPANYVAGAGLRDAVNVALVLGQPLLITGEPGTGKTQLAGSIAHELGLPPPLVFHTKSTSVVRDLFYRYDSLAHFRDVNTRREELPLGGYITYEALGLAILLALDPREGDPHLPASLRGRGPVRSVVLIDEIDKAPRDLPNDLLHEIENAAFQVREAGVEFWADPAHRPVVVITSNSERSLPDAFLRRCVFHYIPFPTGEQLREIVRRRLPSGGGLSPETLEAALAHFERLRELSLKKKPATAELLAWLRVLAARRIDPARLRPGDAEVLALSYSILAKSREDRELMESLILNG